MASITYQLMTDFYAENKAALAVNNFDRANAFSDAENMVNNFLHGHTPGDCLRLTKVALAPKEGDGRTEGEKEALQEAILLIDLYIEQFNL